MKKQNMKKLAFLGMAAGALVAQSGVDAVESNSTPINLDYVLAKPSCKAHGGSCGGLTADRDRSSAIYQDDEIVDPNIPEDTFEEDKKVHTSF